MGFVDDLQTAFKPSEGVRMGGQASKTLCGDAATPPPAAERGPEHAHAERGCLRYRRLCSNYFRSLKCLLHGYGASTRAFTLTRIKARPPEVFGCLTSDAAPLSQPTVMLLTEFCKTHSPENTRKIQPTESTFSSGSDRTAALEERQVSRNL